jgi:hypothetical protein
VAEAFVAPTPATAELLAAADSRLKSPFFTDDYLV